MIKPDPKAQEALDKYAEYFENLTVRSVRIIEKLADPQIQFKDPFNDVQGVSKVVHILKDMFEKLESPKFSVQDKAWSQDGCTAYMKWVFSYGHETKRHSFTGMCEITFTHDYRVASHIDFWDASVNVYAKIPIFGHILKLIRSKIAV